MAFSKLSEFKSNEQHTALICQALSHPARIRMVSRLVNSKNSTLDYDALVANIPLKSSTISQHISYLRKRGIVEYGKDNSVYVYRLVTDNNFLLDCINAIIAMSDHLIDQNLDKELNKMAY